MDAFVTHVSGFAARVARLAGENFRVVRTLRAFDVAVLLFVVVFAGGCRGSRASALQRALPADAKDVHEQCLDLFPDFDCRLRAVITPDQFAAYARQLDLTPHASERRYDDDSRVWLTWGAPAPRHPKADPSWWTPTRTLDGTFVHQAGRTWTMARFEHGYLYARYFKH